jgi:Ca-activated chloride channel family protein
MMAAIQATLQSFLQAFHFLRPGWLLALPVLWALVLWLARQRSQHGNAAQFIDADLLPALRLNTAQAAGTDTGAPGMRPWPWLALAWTLAVLALAGPSWQQDKTAAYRAPAAWVVVLDLSPSMDAADLAPSRVARARFLIDDILGAARDARVGMVAFSDEPYTVAPLTQDVATVRSLMPVLAPDLMPSAGDHLAPALEQAQKLLAASGSRDKRMLVLSDGFDDPAAALRSAAVLKQQGITLSVVGVGTAGGAPLRSGDGSFAKDAQGQPHMARLNTDLLQQLASAGGGRYVDSAQAPALLADLHSATPGPGEAVAEQDQSVAHWRDAGAYILPLVLLLAALLARRRWL